MKMPLNMAVQSLKIKIILKLFRGSEFVCPVSECSRNQAYDDTRALQEIIIHKTFRFSPSIHTLAFFVFEQS